MLPKKTIRNSEGEEEMSCNCKRIKRNFPFGKKSAPKRHCKDCGEIITAKQIRDRIPTRKR